MLLVLGLASGAANAQTGAPASIVATQLYTPPEPSDPPLNTLDTLSHGVVLTEAQCNAIGTAIWVDVQGSGFCVRYWISMAGGTGEEALVYFHGDIGFREHGTVYLADFPGLGTAGQQQRHAEQWSRIYGGPFIAIGRVGAYGSSGDHLLQRRTLTEIQVAMEALDTLRQRYSLKRFHVVGQSGGGHTVAAMLGMRSDLGCAVMTSGILSVKTHTLDLGRAVNAKVAMSYDPINFVDAVQSRPGQRIIVISDPDDSLVPFHSQHEFVERVRARGVPILHITATASDDRSHELAVEGLRLATDCAKGMSEAALVDRYQTKAPPRAR